MAIERLMRCSLCKAQWWEGRYSQPTHDCGATAHFIQSEPVGEQPRSNLAYVKDCLELADKALTEPFVDVDWAKRRVAYAMGWLREEMRHAAPAAVADAPESPASEVPRPPA